MSFYFCETYYTFINSACEVFFGRMKNEIYYGRSWQGVTLEKFMQQIDSYMVWYRDTRIKLSLGGLSPAEYRTKMWGPFRCPPAPTY